MALINSSEIESVEAQASESTDRVTAELDALCAGHTVSDKRKESLRIAIELGASQKTLTTLRDADRLARQDTIVLPKGRYANLSRGKSWCRLGKGASAQWADSDEHRVGPGKWTVGSTDGFSRKDQTPWAVSHVTVGDQTWTIAS